MAITVVQLGTPRTRGEGLLGVPKSELGSRDFYDVWSPELAPSLIVEDLDRVEPRPLRGAVAFEAVAYCRPKRGDSWRAK